MLSLAASVGPPWPASAFSVPGASLSHHLQSRQWASIVLWIRSRQKLLASANSNASQGQGSSGDDNVMVDPIEAKRLAAKQMKQIQAKEKLKRRRQAEVINGTLAMTGLTVGLVIEGQTGKGIPGQVIGYN